MMGDSAWSITTDGGTQVLKMHFEPTSNPATWLDTCGASHPKRYII
jgi:hypothetical protein